MLMSSIDNIQQLYPVNEGNGGDTPVLSFQDYSKRFSEPISLQREDCSAIPFIKFTQADGKFELNPEAAEFLKSLEGVKLGVVAVCGKYRTGKSYLLNKLFVETYFQNLTNGAQTHEKEQFSPKSKPERGADHFIGQLQSQKTGFQVSPTINPCTKGLWIWKKVIYSDQNETPMIVIDTEGLGAFDEDENHDAKIFLLALLLSSLIIYNSVGTIDETALSNLSLVINLSKKIQLKNRQETPEDIDELASIFPTFLWVLRDFTLKLVDQEGNRISSKQYLENALKEQKGCSEAVEQKNRIRRLLKHFFQERDCCTLIRPTEKEKDLQDLNRLKDSQLRKDFVEQMNRLKQKVMTKVKVKVINGHQLNGPMILELANSYIDALNQGHVPNIESAWSSVCSFEQERAFKESAKFFESQVSVRIKNTFEEIGSFNVKNILCQIREEAIELLRSKFLGEPKASQEFEKKLKEFIKKESKLIVKETLQKIDTQINQTIHQLFQENVEQKVRKCLAEVDSMEKINQEIGHLMTVVQIKFVNDGERAESLFHKYISTKIFKLIDTFNENQQRSQNFEVRLMQEKLRLSDELIQKYKEEKKEIFEEHQQVLSKIDEERSEQIKIQKILEQKYAQAEAQKQELMRQISKQLEIKSQRKNQGIQVKQDQHVQEIQTEELRDDSLLQSLNTTPLNINTQVNIKEDFHKASIEAQVSQDQSAKSTAKLYNDILEALKQQSKLISQNMTEEFGAILQSNQSLSKAIEEAEKRCHVLEKKLEKKDKYERLVKNCQRLQCNGCNKLYTPMLFVTHFILCKKQLQLRSSLMHEQQLQIREEEKEESNSAGAMGEEQFLAKIVDMKQIYIDLRDGCVSQDESGAEVSSNSDELVTIMGGANIAQQLIPPMNQVQQYQSIEFKLCILFKSSIWYILRTLLQVKSLMNTVQRDKDNSEQEQCQIAKWLLEIERNEIEENYQRISEIIEAFFQMMHRKIVDSRLPLAPHIHVDNVDEANLQGSGYLKEFRDFFEIEANLDAHPNKNLWQEHHQHNQDDDVVVQLAYDDNDEVKTEIGLNIDRPIVRQSKIGGTVISDLIGGNMPRRTQGFTITGSAGGEGYINHSTIQLDGEKSLNENSSLHYVSFFSVAEELLMKKHLLMGHSSQNPSYYDKHEIVEYDHEEINRNDENFIPGSPEKFQRRNPSQMKPFGSISNRPSHNGCRNNNPLGQAKTSNFGNSQKKCNKLRDSQSPFQVKQQNQYNNHLMTSAGKHQRRVQNSKGIYPRECDSSSKKKQNGILYTE